MKRALIVVDVQNDFCTGGRLEVPQGEAVVPVINAIMNKFDVVIATQDWHPADHCSFASNHPGKKVFDMVKVGNVDQVLWPEHCVQGTSGAALHVQLNLNPVNLILRKGTDKDCDSYSAFLENDQETVTGLDGYINMLDIDEIYVCGLATDYCVKFTALNAQVLDQKVFLIKDACRGVAPDTTEKAIAEMLKEGIKVINSGDIK